MKRGGPAHPKTLALAAILGIERWGAVGIVESLAHFAMAYSRRGDIGRHRDAAIAEGIGWRGEPARLIEALVESGFLDTCPCHRLRIHDWPHNADQATAKTKEVLTGGFLECYSNDYPLDIRPLSDRNPLPSTSTSTSTSTTTEGGRVSRPAMTPERQALKDARTVIRRELAAIVEMGDPDLDGGLVLREESLAANGGFLTLAKVEVSDRLSWLQGVGVKLTARRKRMELERVKTSKPAPWERTDPPRSAS